LFGNLGLSQLIHTPVEQVLRLIENLEAVGFFIHTNPLQEALQPEGTPHFAGGLKALAELTEAVAKNFQIPVVLKEVGCGFSAGTLQKLQGLGLAAVDVSGLGGTHWGRVESGRTTDTQMRLVGQTYSNWGLSTLDSLAYAKDLADRGLISYQIWASGGVRTGLDAAKLLAMGSEMVGLAQPLLQGALEEIQTKNPSLVPLMRRLDKELKIALFCTGCENISTFRKKGVWKHD
jgi:isopentenyl-diphosphate Delta-isomerase